MHLTGPQRWAGGQRWSIATRRSANTCAALAAIATATWMAGVKKRPGQRWSSVGALKRLLVPTFLKRIALLCFSKNGRHIVMVLLNTERESLGIISCTRECIYSKHLHGIIGFGFAIRRKICKSKCFGHWRAEANSSPILMQSGRSMASTA